MDWIHWTWPCRIESGSQNAIPSQRRFHSKLIQLDSYPFKHQPLNRQTSSLGALNEDLVRGIYLACKGTNIPYVFKPDKILNIILGDDGDTDYQFRNTKPALKSNSPLKGLCEEWRNRFRVYFPSAQTVKSVADAARRQPEAIGGTVCFGSKYWNSPKLPRDVLRDCQSQRNVMMHNKVRLFARRSRIF